MIVAWFDPGLLSGVCVYNFYTQELELLDEFDYKNTGLVLDADEYGSLLYGDYEVDFARGNLWVGWENYRIMKGPQTQAPWSLEVIGELKYLCHKYRYTVLEDADPSWRLVCSDQMIRNLGMYDKIKGKKDAKSALQHFVAWCLRENCLPEAWRKPVYDTLK